MGVIERFKSFFSSGDTVTVNKKQYYGALSNLEAINKANSSYETEYGTREAYGRPSLTNVYMDTPTGGKQPLWRITPLRLYEMADNIGDLRVIYETIQREMFRNGVEIKEKYKYKCDVCKREYKVKPTVKYVPIQDIEDKSEDNANDEGLKCDTCGNTEKFSKPDPKNRVKLQALLSRPVNNNEQKLKVLGRMYERHLDIIDQAYCLFLKDYKIDYLSKPDEETGALKDVISWKFSELIILHPIQTALIANNDGRLGYDSNNQPKWICPNYLHRDHILVHPVCDKCGCKAKTAVVEVNSVPYGYPVTDAKLMWYAKDELIWTAGKYYPDLLYGNSPVNAIWRKAMSLFHQDEYLWKYFDKDRPPKSILGIASRNYESVQSFMDKQRQGARQDPFMPRPILVNTDNIGQSLQYIDLTPNFQELELTEVRRELRQIMATMYGIQPINYGEQASSGMGNEALQLTLTNRTIRAGQRTLNEEFFNKVSEMMEVFDWEIVLVDSEEIDKLRDEQIKGVQIDNAVKMYGMGFEIYRDNEGEIAYSQYPNPEKQEMMNGTGSNIKQGNNDKTKSTKPKSEQSTNFDGEPKGNNPSDVGGSGEGSPSSGFSLSNKDIPKKRGRPKKNT